MDNLKLIYQGNKSHIYQDLRPGREGIAIKMLKEADPSPQQLAYLTNEFEFTYQLEVEGIRKAIEQGEIEGRPAIFIEFVDGQSLKHAFVKKRVSLLEMIEVALKSARVLSQIHQQGIIHRDISSNNILINEKSNQIKFIDFAFARKMKTGGIGAAGHEGTLSYLAPEQSGRTDRKVDVRSDLYALGITLYEIFTGQLPFQYSEPAEMVHAHLAQRPSRLHEVSSDIPPQLSRIVLKLIAKDPDDRYQTAKGLCKDLEKCLDMLEEHEEISSFKLGDGDKLGVFKLPNKLYGRETEMLFLKRAFDRVALGTMELLILKGYAGSGKSSLAEEVGTYVRQQGGYFAKGSFRQGENRLPYQGTNDAFRDLTAQMLTESSRTLERWKRRILKAVGSNGGLLTEFVPDLALILGNQAAPPELEGAAENQNRLRITFLNFIKALSDVDHPLVIYLDDCQWADDDSLNLLQLLLSDTQNRNLCLITGLRSEDLEENHPFMGMVQELRKRQVIVEELKVGNLGLEAVYQMTAELVGCTDGSCRDLAEVVYGKTQGSPFFVRQMLASIHEQGLLWFDLPKNSWQWDLNSICLLYTSPSPRDRTRPRMPSSA